MNKSVIAVIVVIVVVVVVVLLVKGNKQQPPPATTNGAVTQPAGGAPGGAAAGGPAATGAATTAAGPEQAPAVKLSDAALQNLLNNVPKDAWPRLPADQRQQLEEYAKTHQPAAPAAPGTSNQ